MIHLGHQVDRVDPIPPETVVSTPCLQLRPRGFGQRCQDLHASGDDPEISWLIIEGVLIPRGIPDVIIHVHGIFKKNIRFWQFLVPPCMEAPNLSLVKYIEVAINKGVQLRLSWHIG